MWPKQEVRNKVEDVSCKNSDVLFISTAFLISLKADLVSFYCVNNQKLFKASHVYCWFFFFLGRTDLLERRCFISVCENRHRRRFPKVQTISIHGAHINSRLTCPPHPERWCLLSSELWWRTWSPSSCTLRATPERKRKRKKVFFFTFHSDLIFKTLRAEFI